MAYEFDFNTFRQLAYTGAKNLFQSVREAHPDERIYGFGLYSDESAMTFNGIAHSEEALAKQTEENPGEQDYYRLYMHEWAYGDREGFTDPASEMLQERDDKVDDESNEEWRSFRSSVFEICISVLEDLINEGFFGDEEERKSKFIHFALPDPSLEKLHLHSAERLNSPDVYKQYRKFLTGE